MTAAFTILLPSSVNHLARFHEGSADNGQLRIEVGLITALGTQAL